MDEDAPLFVRDVVAHMICRWLWFMLLPPLPDDMASRHEVGA